MVGSRHVRRALLVLSILSVASCEHGPSVTGPAGGALSLSATAFSGTGSAVNGRFAHVAVRLDDGRVLVAGGISGISGLKTAELYDPLSGTWTVTGTMTFERIGLAAAPLPGGRVLVAGGARFNQTCADAPAGNSGEVYDPAAGTWTRTGSFTQPRSSAIAVPLADGRVLLAGGGSRCGVVYASADIYDPATDQWTATGAMNVARQSPAAVLLPDGRVLVAGGAGASPFPSLASAEIYDPATGLWTLTGSMRDPRMWAFDDMSAANFMTVLPDGRVLAAGGLNRCNKTGCDIAFLQSAEIFDPATGVWTTTGSLAAGRWRHQMALLPDGRVLVAGGRQGGGILGSAEIFDPATGAFNPAGSLVTARQDFTATLLGNGSVLIALGQGIGGILRSAELFTANHTPTADAGPAVVQANEGSVVTFDGDASSDPDGDPLTFAWDFGDGSVGSGALVTHTYGDNGSYAVVLTVSDGSAGSTANVRADIVNVAPVVQDLGTTTLLRGETFTRDGSFADPGADSWVAMVDYGDGSAPETPALAGMTFHLSHVYAAAGAYTAMVTVTDDDGGVGTAQARVSVADRAPVANAGPRANGNEGSAVSFDGSASSDPDGDALTFTWDFGDGSPPVGGLTPSHVYADNGTYTVTLNVFDGALIGTATTTAEIANVAPAVNDLGNAAIFKNDVYVRSGSFVDPGADAWTATVDYGDGSGVQPLALAGTSFNLNHLYALAGTYTVTVTVHDDDGAVGAADAQVMVSNRAPVADAGPVARGNEGAAVQFDGRGSSDADGDALTYTWSFGDGASGSGPMPSHVYVDNGTYAVTVTVSDGSTTGTAETTSEIANVAPAVTDLGSSSLLVGQTYAAAGSFTDPGADSWTGTVDYGDGSGAGALALSGENFSLSHAYATAGTFVVTVTVTDADGGVGTAHGQVQVEGPSNRPPVANAGAATHGNEGSAVSFDGRASSDADGDALTFTWSFGDGASGTGPTPSHVYVDDGTFTVTLRVSDGEFEAVATTSAQIENVAPLVSAFAGATLLAGDSYSASGTFTDPGADAWTATADYGDGSGEHALALSGASFSLSHAYAVGGAFTVTVTVRDDDGGVGTSRATVTVQSIQDALGGVKQIVADLQASGELTPATANSWAIQLNKIIGMVNNGDIAGAISALLSFIDKVQKTPHMTPEGQQALIDAANTILDALRSL
jgi:PKD repeat protein